MEQQNNENLNNPLNDEAHKQFEQIKKIVQEKQRQDEERRLQEEDKEKKRRGLFIWFGALLFSKRFVVSFLIVAFAVTIGLVAVLAYTNHDFTSTGSVQFSADKINATIDYSITNAETPIELSNSKLEIRETDPNNTIRDIILPAQNFTGVGEKYAVVYVFKIKNIGVSSNSFSVTLNEIPSQDNIGIIPTYSIEKANADVINSSNAGIINGGETFILQVKVHMLESVSTNANIVMNIALQLV